MPCRRVGSCSFPSFPLVEKHCSLPPALNTAGGTRWHIEETQHPSFLNKPYIKLNKWAMSGMHSGQKVRKRWEGKGFGAAFPQTLGSPYLIECRPGRARRGSAGSSPAAPPCPPKEVVVGGIEKGEAQLVLGSLQGTTRRLWGRSGTGQLCVPKAQNTLW